MLTVLFLLATLGAAETQDKQKLSTKEVEALERELTDSPKAKEPRLRLVQYYFFERNKDDCARHLLELSNHHPESQEIFIYSTGIIDDDQFRQISKILDQHVKAQPNNADIHFVLGKFIIRVDPDRAETLLKTAVDLAPKNFMYVKYYAHLLAR